MSLTLIKVIVIDTNIAKVYAKSISMQYTLSLFLVYPLAAILYAIPNKNLKHAFSFLTGFFLMQWIYGPDWIHSVKLSY